MKKTRDICDKFVKKLRKKEFVIDKTGVKTIEIMNASFLADDEALFGTVNEDYIKRELNWYMSMSLNVNQMPAPIPAIWKAVASPEGWINSNYGWCVYSVENHDQFHNCVAELRKNPDSRRAIMIYTRPSMQWEYSTGGMSDFMCTNTVQYLIRDGKVHALVYMRSNDAVFGYKNDYAWQRVVLEAVAHNVGVPMGNIYWNVASLHVYERHFELVENYAAP
jgi:thymidylate synthase